MRLIGVRLGLAGMVRQGGRRTQGSLDEDALVEFLYSCRYAECRHGFEDSERMTAFQKFVCVSFVEGSGNEEDDVVDHVGVAIAQPVSFG